MPFCTSCGTQILESQKFCSGCGQKVETTLEQPPKTEAKPVDITVKPSEALKGWTANEAPKKGGLGKSILRIVLALALVCIGFIAVIAIYAAIEDNKRKAEIDRINAEVARENAEIARKNEEIQRIAGELKSNPNKYVIGSNCIATTEGAKTGNITKKFTKGMLDVSFELLKNCTFENKSSFWIKGINGSVFAKNKAGTTTEIPFGSDCILQPQEKKPCSVSAGNIIEGRFASGTVQVTNVGYSSNGKFDDDKPQTDINQKKAAAKAALKK